MAPSKRFQVMLRPEIAEIVEDMVEQYSSASKVCSMLVEFALAQKGYWDPVARQRITPTTNPSFAPQDMVDAIQREATASERGWKPSQGNEALDALTPEMTKTKQPELDLDGMTPEQIELFKKFIKFTQLGLV